MLPLFIYQRYFYIVLHQRRKPTMTNMIFGKITDRNSGQPLKGLRVQAWDEDWPDGDDFMGKDFTDASGNFNISYHEGFWDQSIPGFSNWRPDIYITIEIKNAAGNWVHLGKSQVFKDHRLEDDLRIDVNLLIEEPKEVKKAPAVAAGAQQTQQYQQMVPMPQMQGNVPMMQIPITGAIAVPAAAMQQAGGQGQDVKIVLKNVKIHVDKLVMKKKD